MSSPSLSRFVFWVFIIYSVLLRQYLWLNYTYFTKEGEQVRVNDVLMECRDCQSSKYLFLFTNISAKKIDFINKNTELAYGGEPRSAIATGILELRLTDKKFSGLVLREAQIVSVSNLNSFLIKAFIGLKILANKVVDYFGFALGIYFSPDESVLVQGLLTGRLDGVGTDFYNKLKASGLLHLAAASGYNVTMVISLAWGLSFWILPRKFVKYFVVLFIILFTFVSDFSPSVIRAGIMGLAGYWAAEIGGSRRSAKRIFLGVAGLLLFFFPDWLYDIGFQLSFAATAGMLWLEPKINQLSIVIPAKAGIYLNRFRVNDRKKPERPLASSFGIVGGESGRGAGFSLAFWLETAGDLGSNTKYSGQFSGRAVDGIGAFGFNFWDVVSGCGPGLGHRRKAVVSYDDGID